MDPNPAPDPGSATSTGTGEATSTGRLFFLDWLRIIALLVLVFYHVGMYYVRWDYHVKSPFAGPGLEPWMKLSEPWRMSLLFMVSGAATAHLLAGGVTRALLRRRSRQLLLPLLCGVLLVVPPQSYFEVVQKWHYGGSYLEFLQLYFTHDQGFCRQDRCLIMPTWNHLWFLPYLWVYTLLLGALVWLWPQSLQRAASSAAHWLHGPALMLWPMGAIFLLRVGLFDRFPPFQALWGDWFSHSVYLSMFGLGAVFATSPTMWARLAQMRHLALVLALSAWALLVTWKPGAWSVHAVVAVLQWSALVAAFGFAAVHLGHDSAWRAKLTEAVFPVYILHQTILIALSQWWQPMQWRPAFEGPALALTTLCLSWLGYEVIRRMSWLRPWFGLNRALR